MRQHGVADHFPRPLAPCYMFHAYPILCNPPPPTPAAINSKFRISPPLYFSPVLVVFNLLPPPRLFDHPHAQLWLVAALLYLNPALLGSAIATALLNGNGELQELFAFGVGTESEASKDDA